MGNFFWGTAGLKGKHAVHVEPIHYLKGEKVKIGIADLSFDNIESTELSISEVKQLIKHLQSLVEFSEKHANS